MFELMWLIVIMLISMINICIYGNIGIISEEIQNISLYGVHKFTGFFNSVVDLSIEFTGYQRKYNLCFLKN